MVGELFVSVVGRVKMNRNGWLTWSPVVTLNYVGIFPIQLLVIYPLFKTINQLVTKGYSPLVNQAMINHSQQLL